ncbi:MAG: class II histone deacetylase [Solirubrobacterales bacterium]|nr:class II histone deacetylase [Solirubrobacterales bacterium]
MPEGSSGGTGFCWDARCLSHDNGSMILDKKAQGWIDVAHVERPERLVLIRQVLERSGVLEKLVAIPAREATEEEIGLVHPAAMIEAIREGSKADLTWVGPEARCGRGSWEPALLAVGGLIECVNAVIDGKVKNAYASLRPPGHHSSADTPMGFCLFNPVAIGARQAQRRGLEKVAILDWDVHHGNGTHDIFYADRSVLFISIHQDGLYPGGYGRLDQVGRGEGEGYTVNIPMPPGSGDAGYLAAFERVIGPALRDFEPDFILISAGQDPAAADPLGRMSVTASGFRQMAGFIRRLADELCEGRLVMFQEGGYSLDHLPICTLAAVEGMAGFEPSFTADPMELDVPTELGRPESAAVDAAVTARRQFSSGGD